MSRLGDGHIELPCRECGATWDCFCKCRERIRLVAAEIDAALAVVETARPIRTASAMLSEAIAAYDAAVRAREGAP